jgi:hypothetical protein
MDTKAGGLQSSMLDTVVDGLQWHGTSRPGATGWPRASCESRHKEGVSNMASFHSEANWLAITGEVEWR